MNTHTGDTLYAESKVLSKRESKSLALRKRLQITRRSRRKRIRCRCRTRTWRRAPPPLRCGWDLPLARPGRLCGWRGKRLPPRSWPCRSWPALRRHTSTGKASPLTAIGSPDLTVVAEAKPELIATQDKPAHRAMCWLMPLEATSRTTRGVCASPLPPSADVAFEVYALISKSERLRVRFGFLIGGIFLIVWLNFENLGDPIEPFGKRR
jgi:hypothetical protein